MPQDFGVFLETAVSERVVVVRIAVSVRFLIDVDELVFRHHPFPDVFADHDGVGVVIANQDLSAAVIIRATLLKQEWFPYAFARRLRSPRKERVRQYCCRGSSGQRTRC